LQSYHVFPGTFAVALGHIVEIWLVARYFIVLKQVAMLLETEKFYPGDKFVSKIRIFTAILQAIALYILQKHLKFWCYIKISLVLNFLCF
jgi:hypothetical protein